MFSLMMTSSVSCYIVYLQLVVRSEMSLMRKMCHWESRSDNLDDIIHPAHRFAFPLCVYANLLIFVLPSDALPLTDSLFLSLQ